MVVFLHVLRLLSIKCHLIQQMKGSANESHTIWFFSQYIAALRKSGDLPKVRAARESMNALYPLTPDMWREWTQDEARLVQG